mgnify:CR=1 FL=1
MRFEDKLKRCSREQLWQEYCGFLDMSLAEYMYTQRRLMEEQLALWCASGLGRQLLRGSHPRNLEELGYIRSYKQFIGRKPNTTFSVTPEGKEAFKKHLNALENFLKNQLE